MCIFLKRFGAFVAALVLCFSLTVFASADSVLSGSANFEFRYRSGAGPYWYVPDIGGTVSSGGSLNRAIENSSGSNVVSAGWRSLSLSSALVPSESQLGVYLSSFYYSSNAGSQSKVPSKSDFAIRYTDSSTGVGSTLPVSSVSLFEPSSSANSKSDGVTVVARLTNSVSSPVSNVSIYNGSFSADYNAPAWFFALTATGDGVHLNVTSFRVVSTSSSAELDALESMASEIANQSQILSQFYGDIVAVCNQIYQRLGDLQAAQEEANALFANVIKLLNTTNGKLEAINMAMSTYFELLINQLKQEGIDTRTAIVDAEARLEVYLKPMIDYFNELEEQSGESASTLPKHKTDIDGFNNEGFGIEADGQTGLTAILPIFTAFSFILSVLGIFVGLGVLKIIIKKGLS